ncbi:MAG: hypothetical protein ACLQBY_15010 [Solirubrobacteraceae bacterium]
MAVLAISAVAVATAAAEELPREPPEFGRCIKKAKAEGSGFSNSDCTTEVGSGAKYEWLAGPGTKAKFKSEARFVPTGKDQVCKKWKAYIEAGETAKAEELLKKHHFTPIECEKTLAENEGKGEAQEPAVFETVNGERVECSGVSATGEYTSAKTVSLNSTFTGCETEAFEQTVACHSPGAKSGEIVDSTLEGVVGLIKKESLPTSSTAGIALSAPGGTIAEIECGPFVFGSVEVTAKTVVTGSVIHQVTANKMVLEETEKFVQSKGLQKPENFDGGPQDVLESSLEGAKPVQAGEGLLTKLINEEKIELSTVN